MAITFSTTQLGASAINYTKYLAGKITKTDRYKDATLLDFALSPFDASFVRLVRGAYITINSTLYQKVFTGYITNEPSLTYLGHKNNVPIWGYVYQASSDEYVLNLKPVGVLPTFTNVTMGYIIKQLAARLVPNTFDVTGVQDGPLVAQYTPDSTKKFQDIVNEFEESASYRFYANDKKLYFVPQDAVAMGKVTIDGNNKHFTPSRLEIRPASAGAAIANDVTVVGSIEPQAYVTEYFVGTGLDAKFPLASGVFGVDTSVLLDEVFSNSSVDSSKWDVYDTASLWIQIGNGYLNVQGGSGNASFDVRLQSKSLIPLDGKLRLTHGDWRLTSGAGYICGLWTQTPNNSNTGCVYSLYYGSNTIRPVISGVVDNTQVLITNSSNRYVMRTIAEFTKTNRITQQYNYIASDGTINNYGGDAVADTVIWNTLISEIDPNTGNILQQVTLKNTATLSSSDVYARYIPFASDSLNVAFTGVTISVPVDASLETATKLPLTNSNFEDWPSPGSVAPTGWSTSTPAYIWSEASIVDSGYSMKMLGDSAAIVEQSVNTLVLPSTQYTVMARVRKSASMTGSFVLSLVGTGVAQSVTTAVSSISSSAFQYVVGTITTGISTIPSDLVFRISVTGGTTGQALYVDSVQLVSKFTAQLIGPNEMDGLDGVAPIATIVSQSVDNKSSYLGTPQYNPGQSELVFFKDSTTLTSNVPPENQIIKLRYRSAGPSIGRAIDRASAATESSNWGDDGVRSVVRTDIVPTPRTSEECELAAAAIVTENSRTHYEGTYEQWSDYFTREPKAGAAIEFLNLSSMAAVSVEEINEVVTTIESEKPIERFTHRLSFGKTTAPNKLLGKIGAPVIGLQRSAYQAPTQPVDIQSVSANAAYASDVASPVMIGWSPTTIDVDAGEDLTASDLYFEVRYTDEGWGVDDGMNLIARTTSRTFIGRRNLRGRTYFIRKARKGNHILWSEDQTKVGVYTGATAKANELGPDGQTCNVSSATLATNASITGTVSGLTGTTFCGSVSVLAPVGKAMRLSLGASVVNFVATGYWQRVSVSRTGTAPTSMSLTYTGTGTALVKTTKWSVEESAVETFYAKTAAIKYGPTSRYSSLIKVSFPYEDITAAPGAVDPPTKPYAVSTAVEEFGNNYVIEILLTLESTVGTTIGYNTELNFYTDVGCTASETGWVGGPDVQGGDSISIKTPPWPKAGEARYVRARARGFNSNGEVSDWQESVAGAGSEITAAVGPADTVAPGQPTLSDWTIADPAGILGDYAANEFHQQMVRLTPLMINLATDALFMTFWLYKGSSRPGDPGSWEYITDSTIVTSIGTWFDQPKTAQTWLVCATNSKATWNQKPTATTPYKSINIAAWTRPVAVTGVSVPAHDVRIVDGLKWFYGTVNYTAPISDPNYAYTVIDSAWVNPLAADTATVAEAWVDGVSKWERIKEIHDTGPWTSGPYKAYDGGRRYFRIYTVGHSDVRGAEPTTDAVYVLCPREPIQVGFDSSFLGRGMSKDSGNRLATSVDGFINGSFEDGLNGWSSTGGWAPITNSESYSGTSVKLVETVGASAHYLFQTIPCVPGKTYSFSSYIKTDMSSSVWFAVIAMTKDFSWAGEENGGSAISAGGWNLHTRTITAPASSCWLQVRVMTTATQAGNVWVDSVGFAETTPVATSGGAPVGLSYILTQLIYNKIGVPSWYLYFNWTPEAVTAGRATLEFEYAQTGYSARLLGSCSISKSGVDTYKQEHLPVAQTGVAAVYVVSKDGKRTLVYTSPTLNIDAAPSNTLDMRQANSSTLLGLKLDASTNRLMPDFTTDFVIDGSGKLSQYAVDLSKSYGFDTAELEKAPTTNALRIKNLAVNKLLAGSALFSGDVVFARNNGSGIADSSITINNAGLVLQKLTSGVVNATVTVNVNGVYVTKGTSEVKVEATGVTITNGILSISGTNFTVNVDPTNGIKVTATGGTYANQYIQMNASLFTVGSSQYVSNINHNYFGLRNATNSSATAYMSYSFGYGYQFGAAYSAFGDLITLYSGPTQNGLFSARKTAIDLTADASSITVNGIGSSLAVDGVGSYVRARRYRFTESYDTGGNATGSIGNEIVTFSGNTVKVLYIYDAAGSFVGKVPIY